MNKKTFGIWIWALIFFMEWLYIDPNSSHFGSQMTVLLSIVCSVFLAVYLLKGTHLETLQYLSLAAFIASLLPLIERIGYYRTLGILLPLGMLASYFWCRIVKEDQ